MKQRGFDVLGNIAIVNFSEDVNLKNRKKFADKILKEQKAVKTVLEKQGKVKGRLRKIKTKYLAGEKTKEVLYRENGCVFRFNIDMTYFSPRLSNERKEIASLIKKHDEVLVMFAGVAPFSIVIAKNSQAKKVYSNEINREANKYSELNIELNKLKNKVELASGDIKKVASKLNKKFDKIIMPRPKLKDSFLEQAFMLSKTGTRIYYYDFCSIGAPKGVPSVNEDINTDGKNLIVEKIKKQAEKFKRRIKILNVKKAGEIAPYKIRVRVDFKVLN